MSRPLTDHDYELISAYLDGALSDSERSALETRLQNEPVLRRELEALRQTVALVQQLPPLKAPRNFTLDTRMIRPARLLIFPTTAAFSALSAAAAVLLLLLAGFLSQQQMALDFAPTNRQAGQQVAANLTTALTATQETPMERASASPVAVPQTTDGFAAMDEMQEAESADTAPSILQAAPTLTMMSPQEELAAPAAAGAFAEDTAQGAAGAEEAQPAMPPPAPQGTTLMFAPTAEVNGDSRLSIEETATSLSESLSVAQADVTATLAPTVTPLPTTTPEPPEQQTTSEQISVPAILFALGVVLLLIAIATTLARRRR
jgi:hypothetical protein